MEGLSISEAASALVNLADDLNDLWLAGESENWRIEYTDGRRGEWLLTLEWQDEADSAGSDQAWVTRSWQFFGRSTEVVLNRAVQWCSDLLDLSEAARVTTDEGGQD